MSVPLIGLHNIDSITGLNSSPLYEPKAVAVLAQVKTEDIKGFLRRNARTRERIPGRYTSREEREIEETIRLHFILYGEKRSSRGELQPLARYRRIRVED